MKRKVLIILVTIIIVMAGLAGCRWDRNVVWFDDEPEPDLAFNSYSVEREKIEDEETGEIIEYEYTIIGDITNSGKSCQYLFEVSAKENSADEYIKIINYGPVAINGSANFTITIDSEINFTIFRLKLYSVDNSGDKTFHSEVEYKL